MISKNTENKQQNTQTQLNPQTYSQLNPNKYQTQSQVSSISNSSTYIHLILSKPQSS